MLRRLVKLFGVFSRRDLGWLAVILAAMLLAALLEVASIGSVPVLITAVASPEKLARVPWAGPYLQAFSALAPRQLLLWGGLAFLALFLLRTGVLILARYLQLHFAAGRQLRIASRLFAGYLAAPYEYHLARNSSELVRNLQTGAMRLGGEMVAQSLAGVQNAIMLLAILALLAMADFWVTLLSFAVFGGVGALFLRLTSGRVRQLGAVEMRERKEALQVLRQAFGGIKEVQLHGRQVQFSSEFHRSMENVAHAMKLKQLMAFVSAPLLEVIGIVALISIAAFLLGTGRSLVAVSAALGLFAVSFVRLKANLAAVLGAYTNLGFNLASAEAVLEDLRALRALAPQPRPTRPMAFEHEIRLEHIHFTYAGTERPVLHGIDLVIPKGSYIGLVGATGAGKSTLVDILLGVLAPTGGRLLVDGVDARENLAGWQGMIGYVPQELFLLDDTIRRNVAFGLPDAAIDEAGVEEALRKAQLLDFVNSLPEGLDALVGERGVKLSGGQRQRISIARALYRKPSVLILDEATAALDHATEEHFLAAIRTFKGEMTIVSIAHRVSSLADCDAFYKIGDGQINRTLPDLYQRASKA